MGMRSVLGALLLFLASLPAFAQETIRARVDRVIDGDLQPFIRAYLRMRRDGTGNSI